MSIPKRNGNGVLPPHDGDPANQSGGSPFIHRILTNCNGSRTLAQIRDALLPKLLSGELRVPAAGKEHTNA
jgi:type I restriction enzyme, S subunit